MQKFFFFATPCKSSRNETWTNFICWYSSFVDVFLEFHVSCFKMKKQVALFVLLSIFSLAFVTFYDSKLFKSRMSKLNSITNIRNEIKYVLFYEHYKTKKLVREKIPYGADVMKMKKTEDCPYVNCIFTHDPNHLNIEDFDAIVFQRNYDFKWMPPSKRKQRQLYIVQNREY